MAGWSSVMRGADDAADGIRRYLAEQAEIQRRLAEGAELARGSTFARRAAAMDANLTPLEQLSRGMPEPEPVEPLIDQLNRARRSRDLTNARLDRLTPEQQQSSLGMVARAAEDNLRAMRERDIAAGARQDAMLGDAGKAAAITALGAALARMQGAPSGGMMQEASGPAYLPPDAQDFSEIAPMDIGEDDILPGVEVPLPEPAMPIYEEKAEVPDYSFKTDDALLADEQRPGPESEVAGYEDFQQAPPPENPAVLRTIQALMRAGIQADRARGIATGQLSMSPDEYRAVTGRRR